MEWLVVIMLKNGQVFKLGYENKKERDLEYHSLTQEFLRDAVIYFTETSDNTSHMVDRDSILSISKNGIEISKLKQLEEIKNAGTDKLN